MSSDDARTLLIVEDDPGIQRQLKWSFEGYAVLTADNRESAVAVVRRAAPPVVTLDLGLPPHPGNPTEGLAALEEILAAAPATKVIIVSGNDERENAVRAIGLGAYDFCAKPIDPSILSLIVDRAFRLYELEQENRELRARQKASPLSGVITASPAMLKVCRMVERAAGADVTVLLLGESGTGKEVLARALHQLSGRAKGPFVAINCAAIPEQLLESELFGFEKGAFTGAVKQTPGRLETADGGTVLLDEIGDLPFGLQAKLLRFLQEKQVERIGGRRTIPVDVRVVSATNQDLQDRMKTGAFREDLFYRLSELVIDIPPLRDRDDDAVLLAHNFFNQVDAAQKRGLKGFSAEAVAAIGAHSWPGNVRELENRVKRAVIMADDRQMMADDLDLEAPEGSAEASPPTLREARERAEVSALTQALALACGNMSHAARVLDVSRPTLYDLLKQHDLAPERIKDQGAEEQDEAPAK